jgi:signal peptidase I
MRLSLSQKVVKIVLITMVVIVGLWGAATLFFKLPMSTQLDVARRVDPDGLTVKLYGNSMSPNIIAGSTCKVERSSTTPFSRGEVVVFVPQDDPALNTRSGAAPYNIKRVIGMPNESIRIANGSVFINDRELDESAYLASEVETGTNSVIKSQDVTIPQGRYALLGDNRSGSVDSRHQGFIKEEIIVGRATDCQAPN